MGNPPSPESHRARGLELRKAGRLDDAIAEFEAAARLRPDYAPAYYNIASIRLDQGRADEAAALWRKAIDVKPDYHQAWSALGVALRKLGKLDEAIAACRRAVQIKPGEADTHLNLANALHTAFRFADAETEYQAALHLQPRSLLALNNYGNLLADIDQPGRAAECYRSALAIDPERAEIHNNLGNVLKSQAQIDDAIRCYERTLELKPDAHEIHSNLLLTLNCHPRSESGLLTEHRHWAHRHASRYYPATSRFPNDCTPDRRLRVGYVSADLRRHSVSYFIEPVLSAHNQDRVETFCYSNTVHPDDTTARLRGVAAGWRDVAGRSDEQLAELIRADQIDILVDLSGHTAHHRLLTFARKPAPIQVTYLGYPNTTGVETIGYRIVDEQTDPPGLTDGHCTESLVRLPHGFLCYRPSDQAPPPRDLSTLDRDHVVFGTFNNFAKVTRQMIGLWAEILLAVPRSRLLIKAETLGDAQTQRAVRSQFEQHGVDSGRIELLGREKSFIRHLATYHRIDIGLDTFPYHGTTTTCEALWMGVPVVTLAGRCHAARVGVSLLASVGLPQLVAQTPEGYVSIATALAGDASRRREIAVSMRERMRNSPLMDARGFVATMEAAYQDMWRRYCVQ